MRLVSLVLCVAAPMMSLGQTAASSSLLAEMRNHYRPVLLFAGADEPRVNEEYAALRAHAAELRDRQMRIVFVTQSQTMETRQTPEGTVAATVTEAKALRSRFHIAPSQFTVVLLGKDGGEKFRSAHVVSFDTLRTLVDAMPMRQQEMGYR